MGLLKKVKQKVSAITQPAKNALKKAGEAAKTVLNKGQEAASLALFAPFAPLARTFLRRRGITPASNLRALAIQVHNERNKKSFGWVEGGDLFDYGQAEPGEFEYFGLTDGEGGEGGGIEVTPSMIQTVIMFLKSIFDGIKAKQAKGEPLSADEQEIAGMAPTIQQQLDQAKGAATSMVQQSEQAASQIVETGNNAAEKEDEKALGFNWKYAVGILILLALLFLFLRRR